MLSRKSIPLEKIFGMSEKDIFIEFQKSNFIVLTLLFVAFICLNMSKNIWIIVISLLNLIVVVNNMTILVFRSRYQRNWTGKIVLAILYCYLIGIFFTVIWAIISGGTAYEISISIMNSFWIRCFAESVKAPSLFMLFINLLIFVGLFLSFSIYDERVCSNQVKKRMKLRINLPKNAFMLLVLYAGDVFLAVNISHNENAFSILTIIFIILMSGSVDDYFHEDVCNKIWYRLLGEKYNRFWNRKIVCEIGIQSVILATFMISAIVYEYNMKTVCIVCLYAVSSGVCWVSYFAYNYVKMKKIHTPLELVKEYMVMIVIAIPGINLMLCLYWYVCGSRRWKKYVGDL